MTESTTIKLEKKVTNKGETESHKLIVNRMRQSVNYPGNTGEQGKRRVNEILIRFQFESFGFAIL